MVSLCLVRRGKARPLELEVRGGSRPSRSVSRRPWADPGFQNGGAWVERQRREYRGAAGRISDRRRRDRDADGVEWVENGDGVGVSSSPAD